jgi:hypothetical protein
VGIQRGIDGSEPIRSEPVGGLAGTEEIRRVARTSVVATGTLACPACDAPVAPGRALSPGEPLACPYCRHGAPVRDFLSLGAPTRPARVVVRVALRAPRG